MIVAVYRSVKLFFPLSVNMYTLVAVVTYQYVLKFALGHKQYGSIYIYCDYRMQ